MDTLDGIRIRRSIRQYLDKPVPQDVLRQVLASAMYAPSACNQQPWQFVVIEDRQLLREVSQINSCAAMTAEAPVAILVCLLSNRRRKSDGQTAYITMARVVAEVSRMLPRAQRPVLKEAEGPQTESRTKGFRLQAPRTSNVVAGIGKIGRIKQ